MAAHKSIYLSQQPIPSVAKLLEFLDTLAGQAPVNELDAALAAAHATHAAVPVVAALNASPPNRTRTHSIAAREGGDGDSTPARRDGVQGGQRRRRTRAAARPQRAPVAVAATAVTWGRSWAVMATMLAAWTKQAWDLPMAQVVVRRVTVVRRSRQAADLVQLQLPCHHPAAVTVRRPTAGVMEARVPAALLLPLLQATKGRRSRRRRHHHPTSRCSQRS